MKNSKGITADEQNQRRDNDLHRLFMDALSSLYSVEQQLVKALPKMIEAARSAVLKSALEVHLGETESHVSRLEEVADELGEELQTKACRVMEDLVAEAFVLIKQQSGKPSADAAIIAAAQKAEHLEIAAYGTVRAWAQQLGHEVAVDLLGATLDEEKAADETLTSIAKFSANRAAASHQ